MATVIDDAIQRLRRIRRLPAARAEQFARFMLHELDSEEAWEASTERHKDNVDKLIADISAEEARGDTEVLDPDRL